MLLPASQPTFLSVLQIQLPGQPWQAQARVMPMLCFVEVSYATELIRICILLHDLEVGTPGEFSPAAFVDIPPNTFSRQSPAKRREPPLLRFYSLLMLQLNRNYFPNGHWKFSTEAKSWFITDVWMAPYYSHLNFLPRRFCSCAFPTQQEA